MRPSLAELRAFYAGRDGRGAARLLARIVAPAVKQGPTQRLLALGYTAPLLMGFNPAKVERVAMVTPPEQGGQPWPQRGWANCALISSERDLPFPPSMFDQALLCHALEFGDPAALLKELWRVLAPAGEAILIVPNRRGIWTHFEATPFGQGHPYGRGPLTRLLRESMFEPIAWKNALVAPPVAGLRWLDRPLTRMAPALGGIHFVLAPKTDGLQPAAAHRVRRAARRRAAGTFAIPGAKPSPRRLSPPRQ
jgi:SAM-dependent methyltransferase